MMDKPQSASGYSPEWVEDARAACLYVATVLGDLLAEDLIVVGGLVPGMLIAQRLRQAGFRVQENDVGNPVLQTWSIRGDRDQKVTVDFLISPSSESGLPATSPSAVPVPS